jgi:hypothetical protein
LTEVSLILMFSSIAKKVYSNNFLTHKIVILQLFSVLVFRMN